MIIQLSDHFTWAEASFTSHREVDNEIPSELYPVIKHTARYMERVRASLDNKPLTVSSWYRCPELNAAVGGSSGSQHMKGEAVDFICPSFGTPVQVCRRLMMYQDLLKFDQLILEHSWVHISFSYDPGVPDRGQVLSLLKNKKYAQGLTDLNGSPI